jgi:glutaconate CoA-transferase subunit B
MSISSLQQAYTREELMTITAARALKDGQIVFVGIGLPNLACNLARRTHAPSLELVYESGIFGASPERVPLSIGDPALVSGATSVCSLPEIFMFYLQRGLIDVGFLGAAQIDRRGNINTTVIGSYANPKVRLPGSGGACEIALLAHHVFVIMRQSVKSFVERVDFVTSPGYPDGQRPNGSRGRGPQLVMTDLATYGFDERGEMQILTLHPGVEYDDVRAATGWPIAPPRGDAITREPTPEELRILRTDVDREGHYLSPKAS